MQWLYRVLEQDEDGDPLDFGVVNADAFVEAQECVTRHLNTIMSVESVEVRFYQVKGVDANGIVETEGYVDLLLTLDPDEEDEGA